MSVALRRSVERADYDWPRVGLVWLVKHLRYDFRFGDNLFLQLVYALYSMRSALRAGPAMFTRAPPTQTPGGASICTSHMGSILAQPSEHKMDVSAPYPIRTHSSARRMKFAH